MDIYEAHADERDKFEILAVHDSSVKSFEELDKKLPSHKERFWQGKDLPFPILLDVDGKTLERYGIEHFPTGLLIDPEGNLVGEVDPPELEAKLAKLPASKEWARHRDLQMNAWWSIEPSEYTLQKLGEHILGRPHMPVGLDADAIKAAGLTPDGPLPGVVIGSNITLRSLDELLLAPHGLGIVPSPDEKKLIITKRPQGTEPESYFQKLHAKEIRGILDRKKLVGSADEPAPKPLELKDVLLLDAIKRISEDFSLPMALDAKAMHDKKLDAQVKVSGRIAADDLRKSLTKLLEPVGLTIEVGHEVVLIVPKAAERGR